MTAPEMTVLEFATKHCAEEDDASRENVQAHVDLLVKCAVYHQRALWRVGMDADGHASLIWVSMDERVWEGMLATAVKLLRFENNLRGLL